MRTRIRLFGTFRVTRGNDQPVRLATRRAQELLSFLVLNRHRRHSREALATLLWEGSSPAQSRKYLRHTLWQVQAALECNPRQRTAALLAEPEWIGFNPHDQIWIDVLAFEEACAKVHTTARGGLSESDAGILKEAVELYDGDLLQDWYCEWCHPERERLQQLLIGAFDKLIEHAELQHDYDAGIDYGQRVLRCDRARERTHCLLMRLYYLAGDRTAALRQYERCVSALHEELDVAPARTTVAIHDEIRADRLAGTPVTVGVATLDPSAAPELDALSRLQTLLTDTQAKIEEGLTAVGQALTAQGAGRTGPGRS